MTGNYAMRKLTEQDLVAVVGTTYKGYTILQARVKGGIYTDSDHYGIVLAQSESEKGLFVTWQWHLQDEKPTYYWGHYEADPKAALADYEARE